ncbi:hypothetical protein GEMRC1_006575 [Eukaryota sp. GEM-RC1]
MCRGSITLIETVDWTKASSSGLSNVLLSQIALGKEDSFCEAFASLPFSLKVLAKMNSLLVLDEFKNELKKFDQSSITSLVSWLKKAKGSESQKANEVADKIDECVRRRKKKVNRPENLMDDEDLFDENFLKNLPTFNKVLE